MDAKKVFDSFLVLQYRSGNKKALELLVKRYHPKLCRHAYGYVKDMDSSKDIAQDSWSTIIAKMNGLRDPNSFGSWAMRIVTRKSLDFLNRNSRTRETLKQYESNSALNGIDEDRAHEIAMLKKAIGALAHDHRVVLRLFYTEEYSLREIAEILEISVGTVKSRLFHAREKLKKILKTENHE